MKPANHPLDIVDCSSMLAGIGSIEVEPMGKKFIHKFPPDALEKIRGKELDVILRFGFNILSGEILTVARYGVWSYHHGDNEFYRGGPPHFWELVEKSPLSGVILQVLTEELDSGLVLCKSLFSTEQTQALL
jgi:methionyl-tRNA formyltransferase